MATRKKAPESKKSTTMRDQVKTNKDTAPKKRRLHSAKGYARKPIIAARNVAKKEYYLPLPDNKVGSFLNKRRRIIPKFFVEAWQELKLVSWPTRKETAKLTVAVLIFAIVFGAAIAVVDYGLDKLFKELLLK